MKTLKTCFFTFFAIGLVIGTQKGIDWWSRVDQPTDQNERLSKIDSVAVKEESQNKQQLEMILQGDFVSDSPPSRSPLHFSDSLEPAALDTTPSMVVVNENPDVLQSPFGSVQDAEPGSVNEGLIVVTPDPIRDLNTDNRNTDNPFLSQGDANSSLDMLDVALLDPNFGSESNEIATITFTHTPLPGVHHVNFPTIFGKSEIVYAHLAIAAPCNNCIVRVQHYASQEITTLSLLDLEVNKIKTIHITPDVGWSIGEYVLELYDPETTQNLVGRNSILISDVMPDNQFNIPNTDYINHLVSNGLATPKQR